MSDPNADLLRRVLTQIESMRSNLSKFPNEDDVARFHEQLDRLKVAGYDVEEFRLNLDRDLFLRVASTSPRHGTRYYDKKEVHMGVLEAKMDAVMTYFRNAAL